MNEIQLLYAENIISRKTKYPTQELTFSVGVKNVSYDKQVDVIWAGEDGEWHTLAAEYHDVWRHDTECWRAVIKFKLKADQSLPGNIVFGLRYRVSGMEFWDNRNGENYLSQADSGVMLGHNSIIQNIGFVGYFEENQKSAPVTVAIDRSIAAQNVSVHWTVDGWRNTRVAKCKKRLRYWDLTTRSNARNPNQYGVEIWTTRLRTGKAFKLQYTICCDTLDRQIWENHGGKNFIVSYPELKVMILNLHCYQEENQDHKLSVIANAIDEQGVDVICLQEVAENWNEGHGDWASNSANIINQRLATPFELYTDWSHLGFDRYREGVAILSRYPLSNQQGRYVSDDQDAYSIHSRKVVMSQINVPRMGVINFYSAHLSWLEDGFEHQFDNLCAWANAENYQHVQATLLCGDFNITAGEQGYLKVVNSHQYEDQYLAANNEGLFESIFRVNDAHWGQALADDYRIDYIFMHKDSELQVTSAQVIFTDQDYGRVSDHCGYIMTFEPI